METVHIQRILDGQNGTQTALGKRIESVLRKNTAQAETHAEKTPQSGCIAPHWAE
jgi:hypothetical protein